MLLAPSQTTAYFRFEGSSSDSKGPVMFECAIQPPGLYSRVPLLRAPSPFLVWPTPVQPIQLSSGMSSSLKAFLTPGLSPLPVLCPLSSRRTL